MSSRVSLAKNTLLRKTRISASLARTPSMTIRLLFTITVVAFGIVTVPAFAEDKRQALDEVRLDINNDGRMDRAVLVGEPDSEYIDLYIYLAAGDDKLDLSRQPDFFKKEIAEGSIIDRGLERTGKGSLTVTSCYGCGARKSSEETLTIVHRGGEFMVAGYTRGWDWNTHTADGNVETLIGGCDINFLTGKGVASQNLDEGKPLKGKFTPVNLSDWSAEKRPKACDIQ